MGQQQLFLLLVGIGASVIAIVVGVNVFNVNSVEENRNAVNADIITISSIAQQYYRKPANMGGGDNSFTGFTIPANLASTANGSYTAVVSSQSITVTGTGVVKDENGENSVSIVTVTPSAITVDSEKTDSEKEEKDKDEGDDKEKDKDKDKEKDKDKDKGND